MKSIIPDLKERIQNAAQRRTSLSDQIKAIDMEIDSLKRVLAIEERRLSDAYDKKLGLTTYPPIITTSAGDFIESLLRERPRTKDEIREAGVERGIFDAETAGRSANMAVVNMVRSGRIKELPGGRYGLPGEEDPGSDEPTGASESNSGGVAERLNAPDS